MVSPSIAIIRSSQSSFWNSCVSIVNNLEACYLKSHGDQITFFDYHAEISDGELLREITKLKKQNIQELIFIDHYPSLTRFFLALDCVWKTTLPRVTIHAFGDFAPHCQEYLKIEDILKRLPLKIIAPSTKAQKFLEHHLDPSGASPLHKIPFAISSKNFLANESLRIEARKQYKISSEEKLIVYSGRISSQKNVLFTLKVVAEYLGEHPEASFILAGSDDNFGTSIFGEFEARGSMALAFRKALADLPADINQRVHFVQKLETPALERLLNAADLFISLSTYHNEDFGMAPLEALSSGCPAVLTDWGGYRDYQSADCSLVKVQLSDKGLEIAASDVLEKIHYHLQKPYNAQARVECSQRYQNAFNEIQISLLINSHKEISHGRFAGFSAFAKSYFWLNHGQAKLEAKKDTFYESLYRSYFE